MLVFNIDVEPVKAGDDEVLLHYYYTDGEEVFTAPYSGVYTFTLYGAYGGGENSVKTTTIYSSNKAIAPAGYDHTVYNKDYRFNHEYSDDQGTAFSLTGNIAGSGGLTEYSVYLEAGTKIYINVGGQGKGFLHSKNDTEGGYNGGGKSGWRGGCSGGGATSIALVSGTLEQVLNNPVTRDKVLAVAGGGGGADNISETGTCSPTVGGDGGGAEGVTGTSYNDDTGERYPDKGGKGGTQTEGAALGKGQDVYTDDDAGAGGGGYYGGYSGSSGWPHHNAAGGGGSGYVNTAYSGYQSGSTVTGGNPRFGHGYLKISYKKQYTLTFDANGGTLKNPGTNLYNTAHTGSNYVKVQPGSAQYNNMSADIPTRSNYVFLGWFADGDVNRQVYNENGLWVAGYWDADGKWQYGGDVTVKALWTIGSASYKVEHYRQNVWGGAYVLTDTDTGLTGEIGSVPNYTPRDYGASYNLVTVSAPPIEADGSTVVKLYYELLDTVGPVISVTPARSINPNAAHNAVRNLDVTISVAEDGSGLAADNVYEYGLSRSQSTPPTSWNTYKTGAPTQSFDAVVNIGSGLNGAYYLWVRQVQDNAGNESTSSVMSSVKSGSMMYHVCGMYTFDNTAPTGTVTYIENNQTLGIEPEGTEAYALLKVDNASDAIAGVSRIYLRLYDAANPDNCTELDFTGSGAVYELKFFLYDCLADSEHVEKVNMAVYAVDAVGNEGELEIKKYDFGVDQIGNDITADDIAFKKDSQGGYERDYFRIEARVENVSYNATGITFMCGHFGELRIYTFGYVERLSAGFGSLRNYIREQYDSELNLPLTEINPVDKDMYAHRFKIPLYADYGWYTDTIAYGYKGASYQQRGVAYNVYDSILLHVKTIYKY